MKKLIPVIELKDNEEFFKGTKFRLYGVGLQNATQETDFYEYMLIYDNPNYMTLANVSSELGRYKAGHVLCHIPIHKIEGRIVVSGKEIKRMLDAEKTFLVYEQ